MVGAAADGALHVIREVALQHAHLAPLVIGHDVRGESALGAGVDGLEVNGNEGRGAVPSVDLGVALVPEEERVAVVGAQKDETRRLDAEIVYLSLGVTVPEVIRADGEQTAAAQVCEDKAGATVLVMHQREVQHVPAAAVHRHGLRKDDAVAATRGHVVHQDRP